MTQPIVHDYVPPPIKLEPKTVIVEAWLPGRPLCNRDAAGMDGARATYRVNLEDWSCEGTVNGLVLADPEWWKEHCAEVGQQTKLKLQAMFS